MKRREFTTEQIEFIRDNLQIMSTRKVAEAYTIHFGEPLGQTELRRVCQRNGIENPRKENKMLPLGTERYSEYYQCMMIKTSLFSAKGIKPSIKREIARNNQWQLKQNYVWEQTHGKKLPKGMVVVFLDGDRMNYDPSNLVAAPLQNVGFVYRTGVASEFAPVMRSALKYAELYFAVKETGGLL